MDNVSSVEENSWVHQIELLQEQERSCANPQEHDSNIEGVPPTVEQGDAASSSQMSPTSVHQVVIAPIVPATGILVVPANYMTMTMEDWTQLYHNNIRDNMSEADRRAMNIDTWQDPVPTATMQDDIRRWAERVAQLPLMGSPDP